jgi:hypothetical protein
VRRFWKEGRRTREEIFDFEFEAPRSVIAQLIPTRYNEDFPTSPTYEKQNPSRYCVRSRLCLLRAFHRGRCLEKIGLTDSEPDGFGFAKSKGFADAKSCHLACRKNNQLACCQDDQLAGGKDDDGLDEHDDRRQQSAGNPVSRDDFRGR